MRYPIINYYCIFTVNGDGTVGVYNASNDKSLVISESKYQTLLKFDGKTSPYTIFNRYNYTTVDMIVNDFIKDELLINDSIIRCDKDGLKLILWHRNPLKQNSQDFTLLYNSVVLLALPVLLLGIYLLYSEGFEFRMITSVRVLTWYTGALGGLLIGVITHEYSHLLAIYKHKLVAFSVGLVFNPLISGYTDYAYVEDNLKSKERFEIGIAGIMMNMLVAGICFILAYMSNDIKLLLVIMGFENLILAIYNLGYFEHFDGLDVLSTLLGTDDLLNDTKHLCLNKLKVNHSFTIEHLIIYLVHMMIGIMIIIHIPLSLLTIILLSV